MTKQQSALKTQFPLRRRLQLTCPETSITDPDTFRELSMDNIKKKLEQGLPVTFTPDAFYSLEPLKYSNLQDALEFHQQVTKQFESLPSGLRKLMGNDLRNFESFVTDPKNQDALLEHGVITKKDATNSDVVKSIQELKEKFNSTDESVTPPQKGQK